MADGSGSKKRAAAGDDHTNGNGSSTSGKKRQKKGGRGGWHGGGDRAYDPPGVVISRSAEDCAPQLTLSKDQLTVTGNKGFRMARATHGAPNGSWYWECTVLPPETREGHCRLGWSLQTGSLQAPVGYDKSSYAYRDMAGSKVHESLRVDNYGESWGPGDIIGSLIRTRTPAPEQARDAVKDVIGQETSLDLRTATGPNQAGQAGAGSMAAKAVPSSFNEIRFFKNGKDQGVAFTGIGTGTFYPAVSLYMGGSVRVNFGPEFIYPPPSSLRWKPIANLRALPKDEMKAQRTRIKRERASRGLETATRLSGGGVSRTSALAASGGSQRSGSGGGSARPKSPKRDSRSSTRVSSSQQTSPSVPPETSRLTCVDIPDNKAKGETPSCGRREPEKEASRAAPDANQQDAGATMAESEQPENTTTDMDSRGGSRVSTSAETTAVGADPVSHSVATAF